MNICWFGYLARNMSWSIVGQNICRELIKKGHQVDMFSTNGTNLFPDDLKPYLRGSFEAGQQIAPTDFTRVTNAVLQQKYDMQLSYTAFRNFKEYFNRGNSNRFGIWNYETTILPKSFAKAYLYVDKILPSSNFSKKIFMENGIPEDKQVVIPHGIHLDRFNEVEPYQLKTKKRYKILANIAQPHLRKNIPGLLESYGKAFTNKDDVCLVLKISRKSPQPVFDVNFSDIYKDFCHKYKSHAEIEIVDTFITDIESIYRAVDIVFTMTHAECFWMPGLEGFAANKIVISPNYGGQLDFMNKDNSFLIEGKEMRAPNSMQYWEPSPYAKVFNPNIDHAAEVLREAVNKYDYYHSKFSPLMKEAVGNYTWSKVVDKIVNLCENK